MRGGRKCVSHRDNVLDKCLDLAVAWAIANLDGDSDVTVLAPVRAPRVLEDPDGLARAT